MLKPPSTQDSRLIEASFYINGYEWKEADSSLARVEDHKRHYLSRVFGSVDIDLFLTTTCPDRAMDAIQQIDGIIRARVPAYIQAKKPIHVVRSENAVTWLLPYPFRNIQVITRLYSSQAHVLVGFDIDCCCLSYDGKQLIGLPRALRALASRTNLVDSTRQSTTYETRLFKYALRGFHIGLEKTIPESLVYQFYMLHKRGRESFKKPGFLAGHGFASLLSMMIYYRVKQYYALRALKHGRKARVLPYLFGEDAPSDYGNATTSYTMYRSAKNRQARKRPVHFAMSTDFVRAMTTRECTHATIGALQGITASDSLTKCISFQTDFCHVQDRYDKSLMTGSFHPISHDWYVDFFQVLGRGTASDG